MMFSLEAATAGAVESDATPVMRGEPGEGLNELVALVSMEVRVLLCAATAVDEEAYRPTKIPTSSAVIAMKIGRAKRCMGII